MVEIEARATRAHCPCTPKRGGPQRCHLNDILVQSWYTEFIQIVKAHSQYCPKPRMVCEGAAFHVVAFNRKTFSGIIQVDKPTTTRLLRSVPATPASSEELGHIHNDMARTRAAAKADRNRCNLIAAGLLLQYKHDRNTCKRRPKA